MENFSFSHGLVASVSGISSRGPTENHEFKFAMHNYRELSETKGFKSPVFRLRGAGIKSSDWTVEGTRIGGHAGFWSLELKQQPPKRQYHSKESKFSLVTATGMLQGLRPTDDVVTMLCNEEVTSGVLSGGTLTIQCNLTLVHRAHQASTSIPQDGSSMQQGSTSVQQGGSSMQQNTQERNESFQQQSSDFLNLYTSHKNCDVTIRCRAETFGAHKTILSARSAVLAQMIEKQNFNGVIVLKNVTPKVVDTLLRYVYSGELVMPNFDFCLELYALACQYDLKDLKRRCSNFVMSILRKRNIWMRNICDAAVYAHRYKDETLMAELKRVFATRSYDMIVGTKTWKDFAAEHPEAAEELNSA